MLLNKIADLPAFPIPVYATLLITQDNGLSAFGLGKGHRGGGTLYMDFAVMFSDRPNLTNTARPIFRPPGPSANADVQLMSVLNMDNIQMEISDGAAPNTYQTIITFARYGTKDTTRLELVSSGAGVYIAAAQPIGQWERPARYAVSFQN